jgi:hypothetical protein
LNDFGEEIRVEREMINDREGGALVEEWVELAKLLSKSGLSLQMVVCVALLSIV